MKMGDPHIVPLSRQAVEILKELQRFTGTGKYVFPPDVIELQLAHVERNKVRAAYNRAQRLTERRAMMQA
jgi:integrase